MLAQNQNVVKLNTNEVYEQIQKFLKKKKYKSENTEIAYERHIKRFFKVVKDKEVEFLSKDDVQITLDDFEDFIEHLHDHTELSNSTINKNVIAVKEVLRYLHSKKLVKDIGYINARQIDRLPEIKNSYGVLAVNEVMMMSELARKEREKGEIKRLLILFSLDTCIRIAAVLDLKWTDFEIRDDESVLCKAVDKGNKAYRPKIAKWFYNELLTLKKDNCEKVFDISEESVKRMMKRLIDEMNIPKERKIVWHSIRKSGVTFRWRVTKDIIEAMKAASHSNANTTITYLAEEDYGVIGAVSTMGEVNTNIINKISHDELLEAISMCREDTQLLISLKIQELLKSKNNKNIQ